MLLGVAVIDRFDSRIMPNGRTRHGDKSLGGVANRLNGGRSGNVLMLANTEEYSMFTLRKPHSP